MDQNQRPQFHSSVALSWNRIRRWLLALPFKAQIVLGVFLLAALLLGLHTALTSKDSSLHLRLQHGFRNAQLTVLVDGQRVYSGKLVGYSKKKYALFGETVEGGLSQVIPVGSGKHEVLVRVEPGDGTVQEETISGIFSSGVGRDLSVSARRSGLTMAWQGAAEKTASDESAETSSPSWFSKYASSLLLTVAGSIASAVTGFAIKELPGYLRARQESGANTQSEVSTT